MITVADLEAFLQQDLSEYQAEAQAAVAQGAAVVRAECRRTFDLIEDETVTLNWRPNLTLPNPPVLSISSFKVDDVNSEWERDEHGRIIPSLIGDVVEVTYSHGYATIPEDVRLVAVRIASRIFKNPTGRVSFSNDSLNYQGTTEVSPRILTGDEKMILRRYKVLKAQ